MNYRNMIVCLDDSESSRQRLDFALDLAVRHAAHLTGLHLSYMPSPSFVAYDGVESLYDNLERDLAERQAAARATFLAAAGARNVPAGFVAARNLDIDAVSAYARVSDLVIAGQPDLRDTATYIGEGFPSRFVLDVARPVLFTPHGFPLKAAFEHVMVAWIGSRESSRALFDALPLLREARRVTVVTVHRDASSWPANSPVPAPDVIALLRRHGIEARLVENISHEEPGQWLLARATDMEDPADLLVAGAYGHNRLAELILGGVTRTLLDGMTLPVLLSH